MAEEVRPLSPDEAEIASGPAIFANRFYIAVGPAGARIAFADQFAPDTKPIFRSAVFLPLQDAIELARLIHALVKEAEGSSEEHKGEASAKDG